MKGTTPTNSTARAPDHAAQQDVVPRPLKQPEEPLGLGFTGRRRSWGRGADRDCPRKTEIAVLVQFVGQGRQVDQRSALDPVTGAAAGTVSSS